MARLVKIRKYKTENRMHYYHVSSYSFINDDLYLGIAPLERRIYIYASSDLEKPVDYVELDFLEKEIIAPGINRSLMWPAIYMAIKALEKNEYKDVLDYCA